MDGRIFISDLPFIGEDNYWYVQGKKTVYAMNKGLKEKISTEETVIDEMYVIIEKYVIHYSRYDKKYTEELIVV